MRGRWGFGRIFQPVLPQSYFLSFQFITPDVFPPPPMSKNLRQSVCGGAAEVTSDGSQFYSIRFILHTECLLISLEVIC